MQTGEETGNRQQVQASCLRRMVPRNVHQVRPCAQDRKQNMRKSVSTIKLKSGTMNGKSMVVDIASSHEHIEGRRPMDRGMNGKDPMTRVKNEKSTLDGTNRRTGKLRKIAKTINQHASAQNIAAR